MKLKTFLLIALLLPLCLCAQTYYNLKYTWAEIEAAITAVRDTLPGEIAGKLDSNVSGIGLPDNPGIPTLINFSINGSPLNTEHGYIFAIDSLSAVRIEAHTTDGDSTDRTSVTIGDAAPDAAYTLTVGGAAIADRWDVSGADFAEYFETSTPIPLGTAVVFNPDGTIRPALSGEYPFGVTSSGAGFIGNTGRPATAYMVTALGDTLFQEVQYVQYTRELTSPYTRLSLVTVPLERMEGKEMPEDAVLLTRLEPRKNPDFNQPYIPHRQNPDYILVGLIGQIPLRIGQPTHPSWFYMKTLDEDTQLWLVK